MPPPAIGGGLYLIVAVTGFFRPVYVPSQRVVEGDAPGTVSRIVASKALFQPGSKVLTHPVRRP